MKKHVIILWVLACSINVSAYAAQRVAILDFELNDITSLPNTVAEQERTASFKPLLEQAIVKTGDYVLIPVDVAQQAEENSSFGYLFHFHDLAVKLGKQVGADWIVVSQHKKPSFLFSYLSTQLINVNTQKLVADYEVEMKGTHQSVSEHGINRLAKKINETIINQLKNN